MVFGLSIVEKATKENVAILSQIITLAKIELGEIHDAAWRHPYIVGFLVTLIGLNSKLRFGDRTRGATGGEILLRVWPQITGQSTDGLSSELMHWVQSRNAEFNDGADNATRVFCTVMGRPDLNDPIVSNAFSTARQSSDLQIWLGTGQNAGAAAVLIVNLFVDRLRQMAPWG